MIGPLCATYYLQPDVKLNAILWHTYRPVIYQDEMSNVSAVITVA